MKNLHQHLMEAEHRELNPVTGDDFGLELEDGTLIDTWIMEATDDSILLAATSDIIAVMEQWHELDEYENDDPEHSALLEAEYRGHKVPLGKPMRGDVKKFKVYVKDPKTGNIKKVNFGHGGKSARRAGQKTMRIKKSNPARRKSFRARHNCSNPGPRTKARYWSCRAW